MQKRKSKLFYSSEFIGMASTTLELLLRQLLSIKIFKILINVSKRFTEKKFSKKIEVATLQ
jgi:hypothetical protein